MLFQGCWVFQYALGIGRSRCWGVGVCVIKYLLKRTGPIGMGYDKYGILPMAVKVQSASWLLKGVQGTLRVQSRQLVLRKKEMPRLLLVHIR